MDEEQINELLECSVCLEQFDQSCKVLPCQHTYCRRCLDEIVLTKFELRCPECRMLITTPVSELPTNILVMRILERLKNQRPKTTPASLSAGAKISGSRKGSDLGSSHLHGLSFSPHRHSSRDGHGTQVAGLHVRQNQPFAKALYSYESTEREDLPFKKGDIIYLKRQIDENWFLGEHGGKSGFFPANFVQVMVPLPQLPQSKALYDFDLKDENEKDCLSFKKDEMITVIRRVDENWLEGRRGDKIGIFPISFVELNHAACMLINAKSNNGTSTGSTKSSSSLSPPPSSAMLSSSLSSSSPTAAASISSTAVTTVINRSGPSASAIVTTTSPSSSSSSPSVMTATLSLAQNSSPENKRHSYTSSTCSSPLPVVDPSQQRHSMDMTICPDTFAPTVPMATTITAASSLPLASHASEQPSLSSSSLTSAESERNSTASPSISPTPLVPEISPGIQTSVSSGGEASQSGPLAPPIYVAIYNYHPQKDDELVLHKGDHYSVVEKCQDGWFKGSCVKTGQSGVFPGNYVSVFRHSSAFKPMNPNILNIRAKGPNSSLSQNSSSVSTVQPPHSSTSESSSSSQHPNECIIDSSVTSGPPPLMPRVAKMAGSSKSRQVSSHLMAVPLRSISHPGTSSSSSSSSVSSSAPPSSSILLESSKGKSPSHLSPSVFTSPHRNKTWVSSHHHLQPHQPSLSVSSVTTPPNVVMASSQDASSSLLHALSKDKDKKKKKDEKRKGGLLNLLKERTSKLTSSSSDHDHQSLPVVSLDGVSHTRSGSYPAENSPSSNSHQLGGPAIEHRKALSLDSTATVLPPPPSVPDKPYTTRSQRNKYCCVVSYPPQMNYELDLEVGDIVYVLRKREDGWYKGTHERTGKTGLFPASFVEKCD